MDTRFSAWVDAYALPLLRWALGKTGDRHQAEELSQEVWLQFFAAVRREERQGRNVSQPEHLLWRIAKYVWCKQLRTLRYREALPMMDAKQEDFATALADQDEQRHLTAWLHQRIVHLSHTQREIMILYYIDQLPQKDIASRLNITEGAVRWHLFDTRRKLREEYQNMEHTTDYVFRPGKLHMAISGTPVPDMAISRINENLLMQNILLCCYEQGRTVQQIASMLGVAAAYVEHELQWLKKQEFVTEEKGRYYTSFLIHTAQHENDVFAVFQQNKGDVSCHIIHRLLEQEAAIRSLGFIGCSRPMEQLLWLLIYQFTRYLPFPTPWPQPSIRPDGGFYWPHGFDRSRPPAQELRDHWDYNGSMHNNGFYWFGLYNFGLSEIVNLMDSWTPQWHALRTLLESIAAHDFDLGCVSTEDQYNLAQLVEKGFLRLENGKAVPTFVIFTEAQYDQLIDQIFQPLGEELQPALRRLEADFHRLSHATLPAHLKHLNILDVDMALRDLAFCTELIAFKEGYLYKPESKRDGEFLTMCYVKP